VARRDAQVLLQWKLHAEVTKVIARFAEPTRKNGLKVGVMLSICQFIGSFCLFSAQRNEPEMNHVAVHLHKRCLTIRFSSGFPSYQ
jgi:hypothetical protein